jgi:hypothetical protein
LPTDLEAAELDSASARLRMADIRRNAADWRAQLAYQMGIGAENGGSIVLAEDLGFDPGYAHSSIGNPN